MLMCLKYIYIYIYYAIKVYMVCLLWKNGDFIVPRPTYSFKILYSIFLRIMHDHVNIVQKNKVDVFKVQLLFDFFSQ